MILRVLFSTVTIAVAFYGLITDNFEYQPVMMLSMGLTIFVMGLDEFKQNKKYKGWLLMTLSAFTLFVSIQGFIL
ncbi:DUF3953 domain-containing protein [Paenibacillus sp. EC2-1]|uniref:DUF3953 domain-containing protein n=1 Tax=Paenibacillus sp. EC2-1 TaxID=3388665 RepID=UPI003BEEC00D